VLGRPDRHLGEAVVAYVALRDDAASRPAPEELRQFVARRMAAYKVPERIVILDDMVLSPTGKVDRRALHARVLAEQT
jgi:long-chain acyl-CoA synthetase